MSDLLEVILEMILLGTVDSFASTRIPMLYRVLTALGLSAVCLGLFVLLLVVGIRSGSPLLIITATLLLLAIGVLLFPKIRRIRKHHQAGG